MVFGLAGPRAVLIASKAYKREAELKEAAQMCEKSQQQKWGRPEGLAGDLRLEN